MKSQININKGIDENKNNQKEKVQIPYISISDSSNMQVESSHFSINNKISTSNIKNPQN